MTAALLLAVALAAAGAPAADTADRPPVMIAAAAPVWELIVIVSEIGGEVRLRVSVAADGIPGEIVAESSAHPLLTRMAIKAARASTYAPARRAGEAVAGGLEVVYAFGNEIAACTDTAADLCALLGGELFVRDAAATPDATAGYDHDGIRFIGDMSESAYGALCAALAEPGYQDYVPVQIRALDLTKSLDGALLERRVCWLVRSRRDTTAGPGGLSASIYLFERVDDEWRLDRIGSRP